MGWLWIWSENVQFIHNLTESFNDMGRLLAFGVVSYCSLSSSSSCFLQTQFDIVTVLGRQSDCIFTQSYN